MIGYGRMRLAMSKADERVLVLRALLLLFVASCWISSSVLMMLKSSSCDKSVQQ
jgi:hypothetical protein